MSNKFKVIILSRNIHEAVSAPVNVNGVNILLHSGGGEFNSLVSVWRSYVYFEGNVI